MKKIIILIPVYNDWESLNKLLSEINENIKSFSENNFECLIVNDASTIQPPELKKPSNFRSIELLNMKENRGHARCNAFGVRYVFYNKEFDNLILMDGDGEDRPEEIKSLIKKIKEDGFNDKEKASTGINSSFIDRYKNVSDKDIKELYKQEFNIELEIV